MSQAATGAVHDAPPRTEREELRDRVIAAAQTLDAWNLPQPGGADCPVVLVRREHYVKLTRAVLELIQKCG